MDVLKVLGLLLVIVADICSGRAYSDTINFYESDPSEMNPTCTRSNKPCRIAVRVYHENGTMDQQYLGNVCACGRGNTCPTEWDQDPLRTITRYLRMHGRALTLQMKFCQPVQAQRVCRPHEVALTLKGPFLPQEVTSVNCRCPSSSPMSLQRVWFRRNSYERHHDFTCTMAECDMTAGERIPCQLNQYRNFNRRETIVLCQCPPEYSCRILQGTRPGADGGFVRGFCNGTATRREW